MQLHSTGAGTWQGWVFQISRAYSMIVRSEEKKPLPAVDMMDMRVHLALSLYVSSIRSCAHGAETWAFSLHGDLDTIQPWPDLNRCKH